jgi:hypothetical protein
MPDISDIKILDHLLVVNLEARIWTARKKLSPIDLGDAQLPPEDLASLGSKRVCNPDDLKNFGAIKGRAVSLLERHGVRFLSGWAVPEAASREIRDELCHLRDLFNNARQNFLNIYDQSVQAWIAMHPQWESLIAGSTVSKRYVSDHLSFNWQMYKIEPPAGAWGDEARQSAHELGETLFAEIARDARSAWIRCFDGKTEITRKALSPLKTMQNKLHGLSFLEPRVNPVTELIEAALASIPKKGAIQGNLLIMLQGLMCLMQNSQALLEHGQLILDGRQETNEVLDGFLRNALTPAPVTANEAMLEELDENEENSLIASAQPAPLLESHGLW